jgi:hypothetical protein
MSLFVTLSSPSHFPLSFPIQSRSSNHSIAFVNVSHYKILPINSYRNLAFQEWHFAIFVQLSTFMFERFFSFWVSYAISITQCGIE